MILETEDYKLTTNYSSIEACLCGPLATAAANVATGLQGTSAFHSPAEWRRALSEYGIAALDLPRRLSVKSLTCRQMGEVFRYFGRLSLDLRDVPGLGHARLLTLCRQRRFDDLLLQVANGSAFFCIAITEESAGSDLHSLKTVANVCLGGYRLSGVKRYISRIREASHSLVFAQVPRGGETRLSVFLVPLSSSGVETRRFLGLGLSGVSWGELILNDVFVPDDFRVGGEGEGFSLFASHFTYWRTAMAAAALGCAQAALDITKDRLRSRHAFGGVIGRFTHLQQEYARHAGRVHMCWLLAENTFARIDSRLPAYLDAAMTKAEGVEAAIRAVEWCLLVHGAYGYSQECGLEKRLRDLFGLRIADGTTDVLRGQVSRGLLGEDLYLASLGREADQSVPYSGRGRLLW